MKTKFYVDKLGNYIGGFYGAEPPKDSVEVGEPPIDSKQKWDGKAWGPIPLSWEDIRIKRDDLLSKSDWSVLVDAPLTSAKKTKWKEYRSALRNIPQDFQNVKDVAFPEIPA